LVITERHVEVGERVGDGTALLSGVALGRMRVGVSVPQQAYWQIKTDPKAEIRFEDGARHPVGADAITLFPHADPRTHSFTLRIDLPDDLPQARPGVFVKAAFVLGNERVVLIPEQSLLRRDEITAVYTLTPEGRPRLRMVRTGRRLPQGTEILAGLTAGDRVVADPLLAVKVLTEAQYEKP
jgi:multidrug efflux pump subunit AcrA (membrane-fusion protein)